MSDINKNNSKIVETQGGLQRIPSNQGLMKINKLLLTIVFSLMTLVFILGFLIFPSHDFANNYKKSRTSEAYAAGMNPVLSSEVNNLKGQFIGLISGSIESKLRILEESIRSGAVNNSLGTLEDLKNEVKVLRSYSEPAKNETVNPANEQLMQEMSELKNLIYVTLASCGLMLAAIAGIWIKNSNLLPYKKVKTGYLGKH
ncbi:conserved hypothetical protein [Candidatus Methylobacter favarea]|uniref:Uncharacterized protein n=1 Tax=Candidatus Methylobacter favarea TaxID=2707345 RepID=A0A8S0X7Y4_9GAMM|nr:hypothetical protein [Candidatus Methylobacter favarea]CAA9890500.1 conserved hypothetical protein [Candidatus Methylobacter favarea]